MERHARAFAELVEQEYHRVLDKEAELSRSPLYTVNFSLSRILIEIMEPMTSRVEVIVAPFGPFTSLRRIGLSDS